MPSAIVVSQTPAPLGLTPPHPTPLQGVPTRNHQVQKQLERVKGYMGRLQGKPAPPPPKPSMRVDQVRVGVWLMEGLARDIRRGLASMA
jgi:hypothetical protein